MLQDDRKAGVMLNEMKHLPKMQGCMLAEILRREMLLRMTPLLRMTRRVRVMLNEVKHLFLHSPPML